MDEKKLYLFFRDRETDATAERIRQLGEAQTRERLKEQATLQLKSEEYPIPNGAEPVVVLPEEWVGAPEEPLDTPIEMLLESIRWFFKQKGRPATVSVYAYFSETDMPKQFWMSKHALLPVWVSFDTPASETAPQALDDTPPRPAPAAKTPDAESNPPEPKRTDETHPWRDVYVFISSTFNDMHAERNYLVKRVFPALSEWCAAHRLRLRDIDLRWGITEEDSMENRRTVEICLANVDRCRPFFLCFVGQRRGWVPTEQDIAEQTFEDFPKLKDKLGASVTEMEVIHAMIDPMRRQTLSDADALTRALFYLRDDTYLSDIDSPAIRGVYTNQNSDDPARDDRLLREFRTQTIPETRRPCRTYGCRWDPDGSTPELGAIRGASEEITHGALTDFVCGGEPLYATVLRDLKAAIAERYAITDDKPAETPLSVELEQQSLFLHVAGEAFIERAGDLDPFETYVKNNSRKPLVLTAPAGMGKSSLLAHWILGAPYRICYRFIGRSDRAGTAAGLAYSIWEEFFADGRAESAPPGNTADLLNKFPEALKKAAHRFKLILVIDAADRLPGGVRDLAFLPQRLPPNVKLILSVREDAPGAAQYLAEAAVWAEIVRVKPLDGLADRKALADAYLGNYLKKLSDRQMDALIRSEGAANPLYLRIVLSELRVSGAYDTLQTRIERDFGNTPAAAFDAMLRRIESDAPISHIPMRALAENVFGWLAHSRYGLDTRALCELLLSNGVAADRETAADAVHLLAHQLREFLTERDLRIDFFYDSFREACRARYTKDKLPVLWHRELAAFYASLPVEDPLGLLDRAYQHAASRQTAAYHAYVLDPRYLAAQLRAGGVQSLLADYALFDSDETDTMTAFLGLAGGVLSADPDQLLPRLFGHLSESSLPAIRKLLLAAEQSQNDAWLKPLTPCFEAPHSELDKVFTSRDKLSNSVAILRRDALCASIVNDHTIEIRECATGAVAGTIPAPENACFVQIAAVQNGEKLAAGIKITRSRYAGEQEAEILVYETEHFACVRRFSVSGQYTPYQYYRQGHLLYYRFSVCGDLLILPDKPNTVRVYRLTDGGVAYETPMYRWTARCAVLCDAGIAAMGNIHPQNPHEDFDTPDFERIDNPLYLFRLDAGTGTLVPYGKPVGEWKHHIEAIALSRDGRFVAASDGRRALVYRTDTGELIQDLDLASVHVLLFLKQRNLLLAAGNTVVLYDAETFARVNEYRGLGLCSAAAASADESFVLLLIDGQKLRMLPLADRAADRQAYSASLPIRSVALSRDGKSVLASCYDNWVDPGKERTSGRGDDPRLFVFNRQTGACERRMRLTGRMNRDFTYLMPDGSAAVSKNFQDADCIVFRHWAIPDAPGDGEELYADSFSHQRTGMYLSGCPYEIQFSADRRYVAVDAGLRHTVSIYRTKTGRFLGSVTLKRPGTPIRRLFRKEKYESFGEEYFDVTGDGKYLHVLFTDHENPRIELYDTERNRQLYSRPLSDGNPTNIFQTSFSNALTRAIDGGRKIVFVCDDAAVIVDTETGKTLFRVDKNQACCSASDFFADCSDDGRYLCISGKRDYKDANHRVQLYDTKTGELLAAFVADGGIGELRFEPDGKTVLFGMGNGRICRLHLMKKI